MNLRQMIIISKFTYREGFLESRLLLEQTQQQRLIEKMESNALYLKQMDLLLKLMTSIYLLLLIIIPIQFFTQLSQIDVNLYETDWLFFLSGNAVALFFVSQFFMVLFFSITSLPGLMKGSFIQELRTLPLTPREINWIVYFTFVRAMGLQLCILIFTLPIAILIATGNILFMGIGLLSSVLITLGIFPMVILFNKKVMKGLSNINPGSRNQDILRILFIIVFLVLLFVIFMGASLFQEIIGKLFEYRTSPFNVNLWNLIETSFPILTAVAFSLVRIYFALIGIDLGNGITGVWLSLVGIILYIVLLGFLTTKVLKFVKEIDNSQKSPFYSQKRPLSQAQIKKKSNQSLNNQITVKMRSPLRNFLHFDVKTGVRDIQVIIWFITGIFLKLLLPVIYVEIISFNFVYVFMSAVYFIIGTIKTEMTSAAVLSSLPYSRRNQALAKIILCWVLTSIGDGIIILNLVLRQAFLSNVKIWVTSTALGYLLPVLFFNEYVFLFGKLKHKYIIGYAKFDTAIERWIVFILTIIAGAILNMMLTDYLINQYSTVMYYLVYGTITLGLSILSFISFNKLFPKSVSSKPHQPISLNDPVLLDLSRTSQISSNSPNNN